MTPIIQDNSDIIKENFSGESCEDILRTDNMPKIEKCQRCNAPEVGGGLYGELCAMCDNDMRKMCMDNPYET